MIAKAIYELLSTTAAVTDKLSTYEFETGTPSPAIFTTWKFLDDTARPAIMIEEIGGVEGGTRGQRGGDQEAEIRILGNKETSDQILNAIGLAVWDALDRAVLSVEGFDACGAFADFPRRIFDGDGFPGYAVTMRVILLKEAVIVPAAPIFLTPPAISGTPEEGEIITAVNGAVIGVPTPTVTGEWYLDAVATGDIDMSYTVQAGDIGKDLTFVNEAENGVLPDASAISNTLALVSAPAFLTSPVISGTPNPGETITAVAGTASGTPTPTVSGEWELDGVGTGDIDLSYLVQIADIGKALTFVNTATNGVSPDAESTSNSLDVESGFVGLGDVPGVQPASVAFSNERWFAGLGTKNAEILVLATPSDIGYEDNKFSKPEWNTATTNGANAASTSSWKDQIGSSDADQASTTLEPETTIEGVHIFDGDDDHLVFPMAMTSTTDFSFLMVFNATDSVAGNRYWAHNITDSLRNIGGILDLRLTGGGNSTCLYNNLYDGSDHMLIGSYNSVTGWVVEEDNVALSPSATSGEITPIVNDVGIMASQSGGSPASGGVSVLAFYDGPLTSQNRADLYNQWVINNAL